MRLLPDGVCDRCIGIPVALFTCFKPNGEHAIAVHKVSGLVEHRKVIVFWCTKFPNCLDRTCVDRGKKMPWSIPHRLKSCRNRLQMRIVRQGLINPIHAVPTRCAIL